MRSWFPQIPSDYRGPDEPCSLRAGTINGPRHRRPPHQPTREIVPVLGLPGPASEYQGRGRTDTPVNRPFVNKSCIARAPTSRTGVPDNNYRGLQQASSCDYRRRRPEIRANKPDLSLTRPYENIPGLPTNVTGVPDKRYRGAQQKLPGLPTNVTGVLNKRYRGAQQKLPGCPASRIFVKSCKTVYFVFAFGRPLFLFLL